MAHAPLRRLARVFLFLPMLAALMAVGISPATSLAAGHNQSPTSLVPPGRPLQVAIPRIKVRASLEGLALNVPADVHAPFKWEDAGWYSRGARPGAPGRAVIFGHLDSTTGPAVFWNLHTLAAGDTVQVTYPGTHMLMFRVLWQHTYLNQQLPTKWMFGSGQQRGLVMFTCAGIFHRDGTGYDHKLLVYARMVLPNGHLG